MTDDNGVIYKTSIIISGFKSDPVAISQLLGVPPMQIWRVGDPVLPGAKNKHKENAWEWRPHFEEARIQCLDDAVKQLLDGADAWIAQLDAIHEPHERTIQCVVKATNDRAILGFEASTVRRIS